MKPTLRAVAVLVMMTAPLIGCSKHDAQPNSGATDNPVQAARPAQREATLVAGLAKSPQFGTLAAAIRDTGLDGVLGGKASYTIFAPTNGAFDALGEKGRALRQPEQRAALAALLREHIVPGLLTRDDLDKALQRSAGKPLRLRSMGKGSLTVTREGGTIFVAGGDGARARLTGDSTAANNGAALGVDGILRKL